MRAREYYGYALIAGIGRAEAMRMTPGYVLDMYVMRVKHDMRLAQIAAMGGAARKIGIR